MSDGPSTRPLRAAAHVLGLGAVLVVLAAAPYKPFELDRFFVPKELVLHLTAAVATLLCLARADRLPVAGVDILLAVFVALSLASAVIADNHWLALRATAITLSGALVFWDARAVARGGSARVLRWWLAIAVVVGAATSLLQAYGVESEYFSLNRSPGGTFGNRNFMAHLSAIGTPLLILCAVSARGLLGVGVGMLGTAVLAAALVLSRSRAAWLALLVCAVLLALGVWRFRRRWSDRRALRRVELLAASAIVGVAAAVLLPNTLNWKSESPYLDSVTGVVNYRAGSGRGRVVQYTTTLRMARAHPLLGVGPGNWAVDYPHVATRDDPSLDDEDRLTANPWPSSDWIAMLGERGLPATAILLLVFAGLALRGVFEMSAAARGEQYFGGLALITTAAATLIVGMFDAVLLIATPALVAWSILGALSAGTPATRAIRLGTAIRQWLPILVGTVGAVLVVRSASQLVAMALYTTADRYGTVENAARTDPGSYRIQLRAAQMALDRGSCEHVKVYAYRAHELFPAAQAPRRLLASCGVRVRRS